jgi:hypothetical protein
MSQDLHGIDSTENKAAYCELGEKTERQFLVNSLSEGIGFTNNPSKAENKYTHDLFALLPCDLKTQFTPFRTADRYGIDSDYAVTINEKDLIRYGKLYPHIVIVLDIQFPHYRATHYAPLFVLRQIVKNGKAKRHEYEKRVNDTQGNAKASYVFDLRWFPRIGEATTSERKRGGEYVW